MLLGILLTLCACFLIIKGVELYGEDIFQYVDLTPPEAKTGNAEGRGKEIGYFKRHPDYYVERLYVVDKEGSLLWSRLVPFCRYLYRFLPGELLYIGKETYKEEKNLPVRIMLAETIPLPLGKDIKEILFNPEDGNPAVILREKSFRYFVEFLDEAGKVKKKLPKFLLIFIHYT